ncbi:MAG: amidophosphoribosyltransferase, partial [Angelakisella sp.]
MLDELHEECGVFGIYSPDGTDVVSACYYGLYALQHRGQQSCGIAVGDEGVIRSHKDIGLISEVFTPASLAELGSGQMAVAHCRYSAGGGRSASQPMVVRHIKGTMAIAHNGSLTNAVELRRELELLGGIFHTTADTEVIAYAITKERLNQPSIEAAVEGAMNILQGAYSMVVMSPQKLIAARDPMGFRPLCIGKLGNSTIISSESCALDAVGAEFVRDVEPGEIVVVDGSGIRSIKTHCNKGSAFCVFEFIYFARPDSVVEGASVHMARQRAGEFLAEEHPVDADVVIGVPDSGLDAAMGYARRSGIPYGMGFLKNKYIGRTFIAPTQKEREDDVRKKLN